MPKQQSDVIAQVSWKDADVPDGYKITASGILVTRVNTNVDAPNNLFGFPLNSVSTGLHVSKFHLEYKERRMIAGRSGYTLPPDFFDTDASPDNKKEFVYAIIVTLVDDKGKTAGRNVFILKEEDTKGMIKRASFRIGKTANKTGKIRVEPQGDYLLREYAQQKGGLTGAPAWKTLAERRKEDATYDAACCIFSDLWATKKRSFTSDTNGLVKELLPSSNDPPKRPSYMNRSKPKVKPNSLQLKSNNYVRFDYADGVAGQVTLPENIKHLSSTKAGIDIFGTYPNKKLTMLDAVAENVSNTNEYGNIKDPKRLALYMEAQAIKLEATAMTYRIIAEALKSTAKDRDNGKDK